MPDLSPASDAPTPLPRELPVLIHAGLVVLASAWLVGGMGPHGEWILAGLASPSLWFLFAEARTRRRAGDVPGFWRLLRWTAPFAALAVLVGISALNPSHRAAFLYDGLVLRPIPHVAWLPASANPAGSLRVFACLGGLACTGLTLAFCVQSRRGLRILVLVLALNALVLAVLGTLQRQSGATGPFFGWVTAPNRTWFSTFLYHNHWGAFAVLCVAATLGLVFHSLRHPSERGWAHGPGPLLALSALLVSATAPLTGSRSTTLLLLGLALAAAVAALRHLLRSARHSRTARRSLPGAVAVVAGLVLLGGLVAAQSRGVIAVRIGQTADQLAALRAGKAAYTRADLYADTWRMAADRPVFGWGLESYGAIFLRYSRFRPGSDGLWNTFEDAHSDWLQSLAELGFTGTTLLVLAALVPLAETVRLRRLDPFAGWLLAGCALVAAYAWLEFPFACPAVVAAWWVFFFAALRSTQLTPAQGSPARSSHPPRP